MAWKFISRMLGLGQRGIEGGVAGWAVGLALFVVAYVGLFTDAYRRHGLRQAAKNAT
jgi:hypothetical protein